MKRVLVLAAAALCLAVPAFSSYNLATPVAVPVGDFGWGLVFSPAEGDPGSPVMLWVIPGGAYPGGTAATRCAEVRRRFVERAPMLQGGAAVGHIYAASNVGLDDWSVIVEGFENGKWVQLEMVTVDKRTASPYGATPRALAEFWAARLKALTMADLAGCPETWTNALWAHWRNWQVSPKWHGSYTQPPVTTSK